MRLTNPIVVLGAVAMVSAAVIGYQAWQDSTKRTTVDGQRVAAATAAQMQVAERIEKRWNDTTQLASATARIALPAVVADMQAQRRELDEADVGECLKPATTMLALGMDETIALYFAFMGEGTEEQRQMAMAEHAGAIDGATDEYQKRKRICAP